MWMMAGLARRVGLWRRGCVHWCVFVHSGIPLRGLFVLHLESREILSDWFLLKRFPVCHGLTMAMEADN